MLPWFQAVSLFLVTVLIYFIVIVFQYLQKRKKLQLPPLYAGWIPWLGCAVEFGKNPLSFIEEKRQQLGPVFTLKVAGERMTFLTLPEDFHLFFQSSNVDFQKAVQNAVQNVASVTEESFFRNHTKLHDSVKGRLAVGNLTNICGNLSDEFHSHFRQIKGNVDMTDLNKFVRSTMYKSVMNNLFGKGVLPTDQEEAFQELEEHFVRFDEQFEYGARLPPLFIKEWSTSKKWLLNLFKGVVSCSIKSMPEEPGNQTLVQTLLSVVDKQFAANWSLLLMWASLANAIPITFWTLVMICSDDRVLSKVQTEVNGVLTQGSTVSEGELTLMPYVKQCIFEAIRLRSPGIITRRVIRDFSAQGYTVPSGDLLMVSPFWAHRNPQFFPEPDAFKPERWENMDKNTFPDAFIAFGGGRYQCPGRWFALMEIHLYVSMFVSMFQCQLLGQVPDKCDLHLVGTQQPVQSCPVRLSPASPTPSTE